MTHEMKALRGLRQPLRSLGEVLRERGAADFRKGIAECPFKSPKLKTGWREGWSFQRDAEKEGNRT